MISCKICFDSSGRVHLPAAFVEDHNINYGQPVLLSVAGRCFPQQAEHKQQQQQQQWGHRHSLCPAGAQQQQQQQCTYLCSASVSTTTSSTCEVQFDASLLVGLEPPHQQQQQQCQASVTPVTTKVVTAATVKVGMDGWIVVTAASHSAALLTHS